MALRPCSWCGRAQPGRNTWWYLALGSGNHFDRRRFRLCARHASDIEEYLSQHEVVFSDEAASILGFTGLCLACGEPTLESDRQVFGTCYPPNEERKDYWTRLHDHCSVPGLLWNSKHEG